LHHFENNIEEVRTEEASRLGDEAHHSALFLVPNNVTLFKHFYLTTVFADLLLEKK